MGWSEDLRASYPEWGTEAAYARWPEIRDRLRVGQPDRGPVIARVPFGVWIDIDAGHPALLLVPELRGAQARPITFDDYRAVGEVVEARIAWLEECGGIRLTQHAHVGALNG